MRTRRVAAVVLGVSLAGCMSMTRGKSQTIDVQTSPPGALVTIRPGGRDLVSPAKVSLRRKPDATTNVPEAGVAKGASYLVTASLAGYRDASVPIQSKVASGTWTRNLVWLHPVFWGIGVAVDMGTGAAYDLTPSSIFLKLEPATDSAAK